MNGKTLKLSSHLLCPFINALCELKAHWMMPVIVLMGTLYSGNRSLKLLVFEVGKDFKSLFFQALEQYWWHDKTLRVNIKFCSFSSWTQDDSGCKKEIVTFEHIKVDGHEFEENMRLPFIY